MEKSDQQNIIQFIRTNGPPRGVSKNLESLTLLELIMIKTEIEIFQFQKKWKMWNSIAPGD